MDPLQIQPLGIALVPGEGGYYQHFSADRLMRSRGISWASVSCLKQLQPCWGLGVEGAVHRGREPMEGKLSLAWLFTYPTEPGRHTLSWGAPPTELSTAEHIHVHVHNPVRTHRVSTVCQAHRHPWTCSPTRNSSGQIIPILHSGN